MGSPVLLAADNLPLTFLKAMPPAPLPTEVIPNLPPLIHQPEAATRNTTSGSSGKNHLEESLADFYADLYFDDQWTWMAGEASDMLEHTTRLLQTRSLWNLQLEGYCDNRGNHAYALALASRRIQTVKTYLLDLGLAPSQLRLINFGAQPSGCLAQRRICEDDRHRLRHIFHLLAMSQPRRGCIIRLRLFRKDKKSSAPSSAKEGGFLQRIRLASPFPPHSTTTSLAH